jgi:uncharacterized membrane protein
LWDKILAIGFAIFVPALVAMGSYHNLVTAPLFLICVIIICIIAVATGRIKGNLIYFYIFGMSLGLLYQTTMMGVDVVGSDIHNEFYYAKLNMEQAWDTTIRPTDNSSFAIWFIAPWISRLLAMDMVWVFKAVLPIFLAFVPVVLFSVFKRQFGEMRAFFATIFFMIIPVFSMEMASIAKTMVAELFFALMVWVMVSDWKWWSKLIGISICVVMAVLCHYTVGVIAICFLAGTFAIRLCMALFKWDLFINKKVPILVIALCVFVGGGSFYLYHGSTAEGMMIPRITEIIEKYLPKPTEEVPLQDLDINRKEVVVGNVTVVPDANLAVQVSWFSKDNWVSFNYPRATLVNTAIGLDFMEVPIEGKLFRIVQLLTQLLIIIGAIRLAFFNHFNTTTEFVACIGSSAILLAICILVVGFADILNVTRFYHFSLFFLSPMFVLGCEAVANIWGSKISE